MDAAAHYRHLVALGRDEFLTSAAPAALVRYRAADREPAPRRREAADFGDAGDETLPLGRVVLADVLAMAVYPLVKKPGASFPDRITIGRTANNDVVVADASISRLHAYLRHHAGTWLVADGGSKNGSWLRGARLETRREQPIDGRAVLRLGDVDFTFYPASDLYAALGGH